MLPTKHLSFVRYDRDSAAVEFQNPVVVIIYAAQLLNYWWDITAKDELLSAVRVYYVAMQRFNATSSLDKWKM